MGILKCAPIAARTAFGDQGSTHPRTVMTRLAPTPAATRRRAPMLSGKAILSKRTVRESGDDVVRFAMPFTMDSRLTLAESCSQGW